MREEMIWPQSNKKNRMSIIIRKVILQKIPCMKSVTITTTMPPKNVTVTVWSWYWDGSQWQVEGVGDDSALVNIGLTELVAAFSEFEITGYRKI